MNIKKNEEKFFSQEQLDYWGKFYSTEKELEKKQNEWLIFCVEKDFFAVQMENIDEVTIIENGIALPHVPKGVIGLINLRGEAVVLLDMAQKLGIRETIEKNPNQRVIIFKKINNERIAFLIDKIYKVAAIKENELKEYDKTDNGLNKGIINFIYEFENKSISCIDVSNLLRIIE
ncbi:MAG: chemotaxis protein CheW [Desulfobacterales bacterium]|nr:chemotaxis protein CheW [Desulfobacterales bacterium]